MDVQFIDPVPQSNVRQQFNNVASVQLPGNYMPPFTHFTVFYRIYVSNTYVPTTGWNQSHSYHEINPVLAHDFNALFHLIDNENVINPNLDNDFRVLRGFQYLFVEPPDRPGESVHIDSILTPAVQGTTIVFDFSPGRIPTLTVGDRVYNLQRSTGIGISRFRPLPENRYFINSTELWSRENLNPEINADVVDIAGERGGLVHSYVLMFIAAVGRDFATYQPIFSTPALIHVFRLP